MPQLSAAELYNNHCLGQGPIHSITAQKDKVAPSPEEAPKKGLSVPTGAQRVQGPEQIRKFFDQVPNPITYPGLKQDLISAAPGGKPYQPDLLAEAQQEPPAFKAQTFGEEPNNNGRSRQQQNLQRLAHRM